MKMKPPKYCGTFQIYLYFDVSFLWITIHKELWCFEELDHNL